MEEYEYARFGNGFVRRVKDSTDDWMSCAQDDVPGEFFREEMKREMRRTGEMIDTPRDLPAGGVFIGAGGSDGSQFTAVRHANPDVDAKAAELGLTGDELRGRLNGAPGGTNARVTEERFDEIATSLGLEPGDARDRFADRG